MKFKLFSNNTTRNTFRHPLSDQQYPSCAECRAWQSKYCQLEESYISLREECDALREERRAKMMAERRESWPANWKF